MRLILVRHGQSEGNATGIVQGHLDFGLTQLGTEQALAVSRRLAHETQPSRILTSPLKRARETADAIAAAHSMGVEIEPALAEYDVGEASGLTGPEIRERYPEVVEAYRRGQRPVFPGEEGRDVFEARISAVLATLQTSRDVVVAVAHGGVIAALCGMVLGMDIHRPGALQCANCSISEIILTRSGQLVVLRSNDTCHLDGLLTTEDRG